MFKKVLILSASAGAGHLRAADAIKKAFIELGAAGEVQHIDALQYTNKVFRTLYSKAYIDLVNAAPDVLGWLYDQLDKPWKNERRRLALDKLNARPFVKMLEEGVALRCNNLPVLAYKIDRLLDDPSRLATMRANIARLARPRAAYDVVQRLLSLA